MTVTQSVQVEVLLDGTKRLIQTPICDGVGVGRAVAAGVYAVGGVPRLRGDALPEAARPIFDAYLRYLDRRDISDLTRKHYRVTAWHWLNRHADTEPTGEDVDLFVAGCPSTYTRVNAFCTWAHEEVELYTRNPVRRANRPKAQKGKPRPISEPDLTVAIQTDKKRERLMILLGAKAGLRCKEIAGVRREDIDLTSEPPLLYVSNPKGASFGYVPLHPDVIEAMHAYGLPDSGYLFPGSKGRAFLHPSTVSHVIAKHNRANGVNATAHQLRHRLGSVLYKESGKNLRLTQEVLRHASVQSTQIYTFQDVNAMGEFFGSL